MCDGELGAGFQISLLGENGRGASRIFTLNSSAPAILVGGPYLYATGAVVRIDSLYIEGAETGLAIVATAEVYVTRCTITAKNNTGGIDNTALLVNNSFWVWVEESQIYGPAPVRNQSRPSVILRGTVPGPCWHEGQPCQGPHGTGTTYLVKFDSVTFTWGGVQYQQLHENRYWTEMGFELLSCVCEDCNTPLFDYQVSPALQYGGVYTGLVIRQFMGADTPTLGVAECPPIVRFNCTQPNCVLDGVLFENVYGFGCPDRGNAAVEVMGAGRVESALLINQHPNMANDVVNSGTNHSDHSSWLPVGQWTAKSRGGWTMVGDSSPALDSLGKPVLADQRNGTRLTAQSDVAVLIGQSGERFARLGLQHDGSVCHGDGSKPTWNACQKGVQLYKGRWDPALLAPAGSAASVVAMEGVLPEDFVQVAHSLARPLAHPLARSLTHPLIVQVSHNKLGGANCQLSAHVAEPGVVKVVLRNADEAQSVDIEEGELRVVVTRFE